MKKLLLIGIAVLTASLGANAATLTLPSQSTTGYTVGGLATPWTGQIFNFSLFNSALGTLTDVIIEVNPFFDFGNVALTNAGANSANYGFTNQLVINSQVAGAFNQSVSSSTCTIGGGPATRSLSIAGGASGNSPSCASEDPGTSSFSFVGGQISNLGTFIGVGTFQLTASGSQIYLFGTDGNVTNNPNFGSGAQYTVTYVYTPTSNNGEIPEPSSVALIGAGLVAVAAISRRKRN